MTTPIAAQKWPYGVTVEAGQEYWWCNCGRSKNQPFCDGSHKGTGMTPLGFKPDKTGQVWLCGCKATAGKPFCNGSHKKL